MFPRMIRNTLCTLMIFLAAGCASKFTNTRGNLEGAGREYNVPPKQLLQTVKQVVSSPPLSLGIEQENKGALVTGWQQFPGDWHIARRWQERTRYRIGIIPDFDEPTAKSRIEVREETEQRATTGQKWEASSDLARPQRSAELLKKIDANLK
jgi:hypothetical protein